MLNISIEIDSKKIENGLTMDLVEILNEDENRNVNRMSANSIKFIIFIKFIEFNAYVQWHCRKQWKQSRTLKKSASSLSFWLIGHTHTLNLNLASRNCYTRITVFTSLESDSICSDLSLNAPSIKELLIRLCCLVQITSKSCSSGMLNQLNIQRKTQFQFLYQ